MVAAVVIRFNNAQNLSSPFGKIHRLDVRKLTAPYYKIPSDNPFVNTANAVKTIWAYGLRNTWRWSFDRKTGDTWLGDVGQDLWEEVDFSTPQQAGGANYGWRCFEGNNTYNTDSCRGRRNYRFPIFSYPHNLDTGGIDSNRRIRISWQCFSCNKRLLCMCRLSKQ
jgi:glucose/arabinose dehydrogenase